MLGVCGWCRVTVLRGGENLDAVGAVEAAVLERVDASGAERLACVAVARGDVTITAGYG